MKVSSPAFQNGEHIPRHYSRYGDDKSPPLNISEVPASAKSLALIMDDPDATKGLFTHWIVFNMDSSATEIAENQTPRNAAQGANGWGQPFYGGPKPPSGDHRYFFHLYALDTKLNLPNGSSREEVERAMKDHVIDQAELMGRFAAQPSI